MQHEWNRGEPGRPPARAPARSRRLRAVDTASASQPLRPTNSATLPGSGIHHLGPGMIADKASSDGDADITELGLDADAAAVHLFADPPGSAPHSPRTAAPKRRS
ncbi:MAG: hypothetical protein V8T86_10785 [Victivallis sp.]